MELTAPKDLLVGGLSSTVNMRNIAVIVIAIIAIVTSKWEKIWHKEGLNLPDFQGSRISWNLAFHLQPPQVPLHKCKFYFSLHDL